MKNLFFLNLLVLCLWPGSPVLAQQESEVQEDSSGVIIHTDPRMDIVLSVLRPRNTPRGSIRSGRGFRIQIYNGNDRNRATELKVDFLRRYPEVRTYMTYVQPQFRVKVGDFKTRSEAHKLYEELSKFYSPVMIVPDIIVINTFKDDP